VVWGEAGIGKTRLVAEFCKSAVLGGATVLRAVSQPHDVRRPMGAFLDLTPRLLKLPGALGTSPEAMRYLQRLVTFDPQVDQPLTPEMRDPEYLAACITRALSELLDAVTAEGTLILVMEDAQWLDRVSTIVLADLISERTERCLLLVSTWRASEDPTPITPFPERARSLRLLGLEEHDASHLIREQLNQLAAPAQPSVVAWGVQIAQGNPFFLNELARHFAVNRHTDNVPASLAELLRSRLQNLPPAATRMLAACATLGRFATLSRLENILRLPRADFHDAVARLENNSLLNCGIATIELAHPTVGELALQTTTIGVRRLLAQHAAEALSAEVSERSPATALASADLWLQAAEPERAATLILSYLRYAAGLGQCKEALALIQRFRDSQTDSDLPIELALAEIDLAEAVYDSERVQTLIDRLRSRPAANAIATTIWQRLTAQDLLAKWRRGSTPAILVRQVDEALNNTKESGTRIRLALLRLMLSAELFDKSGAQSAYECVKDDLEALPLPERDETAIDLLYLTETGRTEEALVVARRIRYRIRGTESLPAHFALASRVAMAFGRLGETDASVELFDLLYDTALQLRMDAAAFTFATQCAADLLIAGRPAQARPWQSRARSLFNSFIPTQHLWTFRISGMILAVLDGAADLAYRELLELRASLGTRPYGRAFSYGATLEAQLRSHGWFTDLPSVFTGEGVQLLTPEMDGDIPAILKLLSTAHVCSEPIHALDADQ
jgi:hypothetical protein